MNNQIILTPYFLDQYLSGLEDLKEDNWILNRQNLPDSEIMTRMSVIHDSLAGDVARIISAGDVPVSIAGDCCTTIGVLAGLKRSGIDPLLIWFDAHGDFNTLETSPSGFLGGMPLAMLAGLGDQTFLKALDLVPHPQVQIILTDGRDLDPGEKELVEDSAITHIYDPLDLLDFSFTDRPIWVHFDTDIVDPREVSAQNYAAPGGPNKEQMTRVFQHLSETGMVRAVSFSSWAPDLDQDGTSQDISMELLDVLIQ